EKKLIQINELLKLSFGNVKRDTTNIFKWLNYLYRRNMEQEQLIKQLQLELSYMPKTREDIRRIIDEYYSFEGMMAKIRDLNAKIDEMANIHMQKQAAPQPQQAITVQKEAPKEMQNEISALYQRLERLEQKKLSMREKIVKKITRNSKDYVKSVIFSYIRKYERVSALQLKEIVVDEQDLCSKSSFYRLLEEIGQADEIAVIRQGKEKHYLLKILKKN
ncbi:MAG: hypothetical protein AABX78_00160, partial [Nanoarchaeota archaeon]